jgi:two-component system sensor histidine kinase/response regulator
MQVDLPVVDGLETAGSLVRLGGNRSLYLSLLRQFLKLEKTPEQISQALASGDRQAAERLAHSLKGAAAAVGAERVRQQAWQLEQTLRQGGEVGLAELSSILLPLMRSLSAALPSESDGPEPILARPGGGGEAELLARMDELLVNFDVEAQELFQAERSIFQAHLTPEDFARLQEQLGNFAFAEARLTLQRLDGSI